MAWAWPRWWSSTRSGWRPLMPTATCRSRSTTSSDSARLRQLHLDDTVGADGDVGFATFHRRGGHFRIGCHGHHAAALHIRPRRHELGIQVEIDDAVTVTPEAAGGDVGPLLEGLDCPLHEFVLGRAAAGGR